MSEEVSFRHDLLFILMHIRSYDRSHPLPKIDWDYSLVRRERDPPTRVSMRKEALHLANKEATNFERLCRVVEMVREIEPRARFDKMGENWVEAVKQWYKHETSAAPEARDMDEVRLYKKAVVYNGNLVICQVMVLLILLVWIVLRRYH